MRSETAGDSTLEEDGCNHILRMLEVGTSVRWYGEIRHLTSIVLFRKILSRCTHLGGRYSFNRTNQAKIKFRLHDGGELVGFTRLCGLLECRGRTDKCFSHLVLAPLLDASTAHRCRRSAQACPHIAAPKTPPTALHRLPTIKSTRWRKRNPYDSFGRLLSLT